MKTKQTVHHVVEGAMSLFLTLALAPLALGQGALTPPGAPAPMMKTLQQVEPRTPISFVPFTISTPGSYYLTTNLVGAAGTNGITISSPNVALDLGGFSLLGVPGSGAGVYVSSACHGVTVRNGNISGWAGGGVESWGQDVVLENLSTFRNGYISIVSYGQDCVIRSCSAISNNMYGIVINSGVISGCRASGNNYGIGASSSTVANCAAQNNNNTGIDATYSTVNDCQSQGNYEYGIYAHWSTLRGCASVNSVRTGLFAYHSSVVDCRVDYSGEVGIYASAGVVSGCHATGNGLSGILVPDPGSQIVGNTCYDNNTSANTNHAGISIGAPNNRVEGNHVAASGYAGIAVLGGYAGNVIVRNTVSDNGANNYLTNSTSAFGPIITASGTITNLNPWANFSY